MAPVQLPGHNVPLLTGPMVLGYMWSYCLYGVLVVQVYMYTETFPKDRLGLKIFGEHIGYLADDSNLTTLSNKSGVMNIGAWNQYGPGWGDVETLLFLDWSWKPLAELNAILAGMAQIFYVWRIYRLTQSIWLPLLIQAVSIMQISFAFYFSIAVFVRGSAIDKLFELSPEISVWLSGSAACDVLITISLVWILSRRRNSSNFAKTTSLISKLIRFTVETGAVTTAGALLELVLWLSCNQYNFHFIMFLVLGKLYSNVLMATLNSRAPMFREQQSANATLNLAPSAFWADANANDGLRKNHESASRGLQISHGSRSQLHSYELDLDYLSNAANDGFLVIIDTFLENSISLLIFPGFATKDVLAVDLPDLTFSNVERMHGGLKSLIRNDMGLRVESTRYLPVHRFVNQDAGLRDILSDLWYKAVLPIICEAMEYRPSLVNSDEGAKRAHVRWCTTGYLFYLPLHAAGDYSIPGKGHRVFDFLVSSYIPTLAIIPPAARQATTTDSTRKDGKSPASKVAPRCRSLSANHSGQRAAGFSIRTAPSSIPYFRSFPTQKHRLAGPLSGAPTAR
ncbi:hypothetical protein CPB85DRAFT_1255382 [Mucidula mucida]|nr:hypothetical protein CPB85DRAFT_1255382 [Mucidula mucida]